MVYGLGTDREPGPLRYRPPPVRDPSTPRGPPPPGRQSHKEYDRTAGTAAAMVARGARSAATGRAGDGCIGRTPAPTEYAAYGPGRASDGEGTTRRRLYDTRTAGRTRPYGAPRPQTHARSCAWLIYARLHTHTIPRIYIILYARTGRRRHRRRTCARCSYIVPRALRLSRGRHTAAGGDLRVTTTFTRPAAAAAAAAGRTNAKSIKSPPPPPPPKLPPPS